MKGPGWGVGEEVLRLLPGPSFEVEQTTDDKGLPIEMPVQERKLTGAFQLTKSSVYTNVTQHTVPANLYIANRLIPMCTDPVLCFACHWAGGTKKRRVMLVVFIGGVTFAEIAALRFLGARPEVNCTFVIATTKLINGTSLLESILDDSITAAMDIAPV